MIKNEVWQQLYLREQQPITFLFYTFIRQSKLDQQLNHLQHRVTAEWHTGEWEMLNLCVNHAGSDIENSCQKLEKTAKGPRGPHRKTWALALENKIELGKDKKKHDQNSQNNQAEIQTVALVQVKQNEGI